MRHRPADCRDRALGRASHRHRQLSRDAGSGAQQLSRHPVRARRRNRLPFRRTIRRDFLECGAALGARSPGRCVESIARALRPGGRFVAEFGGQGNIRIRSGGFARHVWDPPPTNVTHGITRASPTSTRCSSGTAWKCASPSCSIVRRRSKARTAWKTGCECFADLSSTIFRSNSGGKRLQELVARLRPTQYRDGVWTLDYRRLRVVAIKPR